MDEIPTDLGTCSAPKISQADLTCLQSGIAATLKFEHVRDYDNNNGQPQPPPPPPVDYRDLGVHQLIVYCDYSRFREGEHCDGHKAKGIYCDTSIGMTMNIDAPYRQCKGKTLASFFSDMQASTKSRHTLY